ncbi:MAG: hypothetical protein ACKVS6_10025 [Planctomycetota bacterium]
MGDSVAFGLGIGDEETIAQRLEENLALTIGEGAPRPIVNTVACPGWSFENAYYYLLTRWNDYNPKIVSYVPTDNDLDDSYAVMETGHRVGVSDPLAGASRGHFSISYHYSLAHERRRAFPAGNFSDTEYALLTGVSPEAITRWNRFAERIADLDARLKKNGKLIVLFMERSWWMERALQFIMLKDPNVAFCYTFEKGDNDGLGDDPHPNAACAAALGWRLAKYIIDDKIIPGAGARPLPAENANYKNRTLVLPLRREILDRKRKFDELANLRIGPKISILDGTGWSQIYGGIAHVGQALYAASCTLRAKGARTLILEIDRYTGTTVLLPFNITITTAGSVVGSVEVTEPGSSGAVASYSIPIPPNIQLEDVADFDLHASRWTSRHISGVRRPFSYKLRSIQLE